MSARSAFQNVSSQRSEREFFSTFCFPERQRRSEPTYLISESPAAGVFEISMYLLEINLAIRFTTQTAHMA